MTKAERKHLDAVASLGCIIYRMPAEIHHLRHGMGMGQRNSHDKAIPLCINHHRGKEGFHTLGSRSWQRKFGYETDLLAKTIDMLK